MFFRTLFDKVKLLTGPQTEMTLPADALPDVMRMIAATRPDEIGCDECFEQLGRFAELSLAGRSAAKVLPLVQQHLERCGDCREEFEALLAALQANKAGATHDSL